MAISALNFRWLNGRYGGLPGLKKNPDKIRNNQRE
jgi:hypothetical protein